MQNVKDGNSRIILIHDRNSLFNKAAASANTLEISVTQDDFSAKKAGIELRYRLFLRQLTISDSVLPPDPANRGS